MKNHLPVEPFNRVAQPPRTLTREDRISLLADTARLLMSSRDEGEKWLGNALDAWLHSPGTDLCRDHLRIMPGRGDHETVWRIVQLLERGRR